MKFLWTAINVADLDESIEFYANLLGLKVQKRFLAGPAMEIAFLGNGTDNETLLELLADGNSGEINYGESISIGFAVDSVDAMLEKMKTESITVCRGPIETPRSIFFYIKDPNGLNVQFFQQK
jgi:lactoylglutathione lyase